MEHKPSDTWSELERDFGSGRLGKDKESANEPLLKVRSANQCLLDARSKPIPNMLFGELWHEGELAILFADTNVGKSILAVQVGDNISKGRSPPVFQNRGGKQPVIYLDFELSDKQFQQRYSIDFENEYQFDDQFYRVELNPEFTDFDRFEDVLRSSLESLIEESGAKVLIVDNLTYLKTQSTDTAKEALPLMKFLKDIKTRYSLSVLVLAHTPKRDNSRNLTVNDLAGSKQLSNFSDAIFAIGHSEREPDLRYIKQLKARATPMIYDSDNVIECRIAKEGNFLGFHFERYGYEQEHLKAKSDKQLSELDEQIIALKEQNNGISNADIARQLCTNKMRVGRVLERNSNTV
ncbi:AAA family ATPase [Fibrella aquatilis]|uniref:AAA family ATPase n=1 Tax=Fibrella aquatilis TaxID=2817059 RepID=A0A939G7B5_9BACT|nr:AAA family ATPase [Fibrella aquatilis]MBO0932548.1 AAA family ATPase [Fibrella aquatilis]